MDKQQAATGYVDKNGTTIYEGDKLLHTSIDGPKAVYIVEWSAYRESYIGNGVGEIYDLAPSNFKTAIIINN